MASSKPTELQLVSSSDDAAADGDHIELLNGLERLRVEAKFTREDVASHLHLSSGVVAAIEENRFTELPEPTYVKGYLRSYAQLLGLDPGPYVRAFNKLGIADPALDFSPQPQNEFASNLGLKWGTAGIAVLLAGSLTAWWLNETRQPDVTQDSQVQFSDTAPGLTPVAPVVTEVQPPELQLPTVGDVKPESDDTSGAEEISAQASSETGVRTREIRSEFAAGSIGAAESPAAAASTPTLKKVTPDPALMADSSPPLVEITASATQGEASAVAEPSSALVPIPTSMPSIARVNEKAQTAQQVAPVSVRPAPSTSAPAQESLRPADNDLATQLPTNPVRAQSAPGKDALQLKFTQASWVEIYDANDVRVLYGLIPPDTSRTITGTAPFNAIIGNAPGVEIEINERPFDVSSHVRRDNTARLTIAAPGADL